MNDADRIAGARADAVARSDALAAQVQALADQLRTGTYGR